MDPPEPASSGRAATCAKPEKTVTISSDMLNELLSAASSMMSNSKEKKLSRLNKRYIKISSKVKEVINKERQFTYFPLLPLELRREIWEYYLTDEVIVMKWQSHVGIGGFLECVGINANTILGQVSREALSRSASTPKSLSSSAYPFNYNDMFSEGYPGLPILRKSRGIPRIAFEAKDWASAMLEDNYIHPDPNVDSVMGILAAIQFLEVREVIIVVHQETTSKNVRFANPTIDLEDTVFSSARFDAFSRWISMMFTRQPTRPVTWRTLEEMTEELLVDKNDERVTQRDDKLVALNLTLDQFRAREKLFMWSRCDGWVCPKIRYLEAV
ncbi:hypothetical protein HYALB_00005461 [Hymenoscyphus albidus]|uniref:2EXR domain-containing protein n=1 Tax=Hymenoscyphus albidus TaxID=595503 RepID=A0A9N9LZB9_9HELO|nr:hypothetical protein HYALB_00005461 [Hymenoscyphus albidus]